MGNLVDSALSMRCQDTASRGLAVAKINAIPVNNIIQDIEAAVSREVTVATRKDRVVLGW